MGLQTSPHDPCVFFGSLKNGLPPIYVGLYVDDFKYFSSSDETELLFEQILSTKCTVDFMGEVSWFLGSKYEWENLPDGRLSVSITQTARAEELLDDHGMTDCNPVASPYRSGHSIDSVVCDDTDPKDKPDLVLKFQSLVGGLLWLQRQSRLDISAVTILLSRFSHNPSLGHYEWAKYVLKYLKGTLDRGIRFTQGGSPVEINVAFPTHDGVYTDANWGPQDASHPKGDEKMDIEDCQSLLGHVIMRMGGPIVRGCTRETETMSQSSCESEIYSLNEGTKSILNIQNLLFDFKYAEASLPTPMYNDNRGAVDWSKGCSVSKKLRHINLRELLVRLHQRLNNIQVMHIAGKRNISDILTKEEKDPLHFPSMAFTITTPRLLEDWDFSTGDTLLSDGTIERPRSKQQQDPMDATCTVPTNALSKGLGPSINIVACAARGVITRACPLYNINGWISAY